ncbi:hypothetical protein ATO13_21931 [Stappia sp. 22II-S9-Z10]|nr:hypothetical protein ATO13_21931 [Stappia sp. 22II-S9-Z10]
MATQSVKVLCARCHLPPEPVREGEAEDWFACPNCGEGDTSENIIREAKEHAKEVAARSFQETLRKTATRSKIMKFSAKPIPKGHYRFVSDFEA